MALAEPSTLPLILLAEDTLIDVFFMRRALMKAALANPIVIVRDGQEAIEYLDGQGTYADRRTYPLPSLLLLDLEMPRVDGFGVLTWLQTQTAFARLPKVVLSSCGEHEYALKARELGADEYRVKPAAPDELIQILHELHARWLAPAPAPAAQPPSAQADLSPQSHL